jgi:flavin-dependent dehydrogenase
MRKIIFPIFLFVCFVILGVGNATACSCIPKDDNSIKKQVEEAYKTSTAVFVGEVIAIDKEPDTYFVKIKFKVKKIWSDKSHNEVTVTTGQGGGDCGYNFEIGEKYVVYADGNKDNLKTNICTRTSLYKSNEDITFLNKIKKPKIKSSLK